MSAMGELAAAGATDVFEPGDLVARHPFSGAADPFPWRVHGFRQDRILWRLVHPVRGVYVDACPREVIRLGRPDALETAGLIRPLWQWDRDVLRAFLELPAGTPCGECGRPRMTEGED